VTESLILRELLAAGQGWVSGGAMATKLGVSRVSVWHQMEKLRSQGFEFEAQPARGYRLSKMPPMLHPGLVEAQLKVRRKGFGFEVRETIDSTNDECARQLAAGPRGALRRVRAPEADEGPRTLRARLAQRVERQPLRQLRLPPEDRTGEDADLHPLDGRHDLRAGRQVRHPSCPA
jgi:biotin operon repressor BirA-like protein